ncbi:MAG: nucleotidyltransferase domain-containing protein [Deltaproteobacteria bacterium]|jgi:predicted nucleotidyltransferase|nr:nucleotidyltransferase domain-containing protein [Deltaproteobacteria bacterium]
MPDGNIKMLENIELSRLVNFIVSTVSPKKIILFGSRARGDHNEDSDYDILLIMDTSFNRIDLISSLYSALRQTDLTKNIDFLAISSDRYDELKSDIGYIYKVIEREGKVVYVK